MPSPLTGRELLARHPSQWAFNPPTNLPEGDEFVGFGADWAAGTLLAAYSAGYFPMPERKKSPRGSVPGWWSPDPRGVLPLSGLRVTRSMRQSAKRYRVTVDRAFDEVVKACANPTRPHGWISADVRIAYGNLFDLGIAHSVEAWLGDDLVGGLYGVEIGGLFAGESMFHTATDASKVALMHLVEILASGESPDLRLLDVQWPTEHLASLGVVPIGRVDYLRLLDRALDLRAAFSPPSGS